MLEFAVPKRRAALTAVFGAALAFFALYLGRSAWLPFFGTFLVVADPLTPAEAVLPLAGHLERVVYAADLYRGGYARQVLVTNLPLETAAARAAHLGQVRATLGAGGVPDERLTVIPGFALTTFGEARRVRAALEHRGVRSLLVVTSPWHTRRARLGLQDVFRGSGIRVSVQPAGGVPGGVMAGWWRVRDTRRAVVSEYAKLAAYALGIR